MTTLQEEHDLLKATHRSAIDDRNKALGAATRIKEDNGLIAERNLELEDQV